MLRQATDIRSVKKQDLSMRSYRILGAAARAALIQYTRAVDFRTDPDVLVSLKTLLRLLETSLQNNIPGREACAVRMIGPLANIIRLVPDVVPTTLIAAVALNPHQYPLEVRRGIEQLLSLVTSGTGVVA